MKNPDKKPSNHSVRRSVILDLLDTKGFFTMEQLEEVAEKRERLSDSEKDNYPAFSVGYESLKSDIVAIQVEQNITLAEASFDNRKYWFDPRRYNLTTKKLRSRNAAREKRAISRLLGGITFGVNPRSFEASESRATVSNANLRLVGFSDENKRDGREKDMHHYSSGNCDDLIKRLKCWDLNHHLIHKLEEFWGCMTRRIAIDTGTTMDDFAKSTLANARFIQEPDLLTSLEVCVNSREGFNILGNPRVEAKTLCLGGFQEESAEALCGAYTEKFLECLDLRFGITFVGATSVDLRANQFGSDHPQDGQIKRKLLERGSIRIVVADSTKFSYESVQSYHPFCPILTECVDLIVTDSFEGILNNIGMNPSSNNEVRHEQIKKIFSSRVPVIEAGELLLSFVASEVETEQRIRKNMLIPDVHPS